MSNARLSSCSSYRVDVHEVEDSRNFEADTCQNRATPEREYQGSESEVSLEPSECDQEELDESVVEDMRKLEENFKGISERFRLINRIGEGPFPKFSESLDISVLTVVQRHIFDCV